MTAVADPTEPATATPANDGTDEGGRPVEHLDVLIVGAGLSGIGAAHHLQTDSPWASYAVFEARAAIGGTWDLFRYPGIRSDSDMFTLGYPFRLWPGEKSIADGDSILQYIEDTATEAGIDEKIRYHHRITDAAWSTEEARWHVTAERSDSGETVEVTCGFLFSCSGYYRYDRGHEPDFAGKDDFTGQIIAPQFWPQDLDYADKKVVVIGSGATAITLVPSLAKGGAQVTMLQRSPTYVASLPGTNPLANLMRKVLPERVSAPTIRWMNALMTQGSYRLSRKRPDLMKRILLKGVARELPDGYDVATHFTPKYDPWDQRLCVVPNGDLFKAITKGTAEVVTDHIDRFTPDGIRLASGREIPADIIVTATGLELLFIGGIDVTVDGETVDVSERFAYKGMMLEGVPNMAMAIGYTNASWTLKADLTSGYVTRLLNHLRATGMRQATPENHDASLSPAPLLSLTAGYVTRSADQFPKQGDKFPWQVHQSYLLDYRALKNKAVDQDTMVFSNPAPAGSRRPSAVARRPSPVGRVPGIRNRIHINVVEESS